jgi:hypothetical protein
MTKTFPVPVGEVVERCQHHLTLLEPGSEPAEITEHAISLALSTERQQKQTELLLGDVLRDSRRTVLRSRTRRLRLVSDLGRLAGEGIATGGLSGFADYETPELHALARELIALLRARACELGGPAPRVLAGLLVNETEAETAQAAGISRSTVTRARRALRTYAAEQGYQPVAA